MRCRRQATFHQQLHSICVCRQASAVVAARREIVNGAVSMCDDAMAQITDAGLCTFNDRQKAETIANLLIVLCSDSQVVPTLPLSARGGK